MSPGDEFIEQQVPLVHRALLPKPFSAAYAAVEDLVREVPFLQCPPAKLARGHLTAWAVDFAVSQMIESGSWTVEGYDWPWFAKPTGKYLRIFTKDAILTINQLPDTVHRPRYADFRENDGYSEQISLFPEEKNLGDKRRPHLLLLHGYHSLDFINIAMPNKEKYPVWLGMSKNVLQEIHDISVDLVPAEGPKTVSPGTIKEELKKKIHDNHG